MSVQIQLRRDTLANWTAVNPILAEGEQSYVTDGAPTQKIKIGDGATAWLSLPYFAGAGGGGSWGSITGTLSSQTDLQSALDGKVDENASITGATKTKITYDAKGLVTAGADATTADIADSTNKRYVTDAQLAAIGTTSFPLLAPDGSVSAPSYAFGETGNDTGLYHTGDGNLSIAANGNRKVSIDPSSITFDVDINVSDVVYPAKTANTFLSGPSTGSPAVPTFRTIANGDISNPALPWPLVAPTSTAASPSYQFDSDSGMFSTGDGNVSFSANNVTTLEITPSQVDVTGDLDVSGKQYVYQPIADLLNEDPAIKIDKSVNNTANVTGQYAAGLGSAVLVSDAFNHTNSFYLGAVGEVRYQSAEGASAICGGVQGSVDYNSTGTLFAGIGLSANVVNNNATGVVTTAVGVLSEIANDGGGGVTTGFNFRVDKNEATTAWGFYCDQDIKHFLGGATLLGGTNDTLLDASAAVQVESTTKGFLPPRMTTTEIAAISSPAAGLIVYDTVLNKHFGFDGTIWNAFY